MENRRVLDYVAAGAIAGGIAKVAVGFKEGIVGGAIGGVVNNGISYGLNKLGLSPSASTILAFATTALIDLGGLHAFGTTDNTLIPYRTEDNLYMHHLVFYSALGLIMVGFSAYRNGGFSFFSNKANASQQAEQQTLEPHYSASM